MDYLTKITKPNLGIITNISYAHSKNFNNIKQIANAKGEIINNIKKNGAIVLNMDDKFFYYHKNLALKKKSRSKLSSPLKYSLKKPTKIKETT